MAKYTHILYYQSQEAAEQARAYVEQPLQMHQTDRPNSPVAATFETDTRPPWQQQAALVDQTELVSAIWSSTEEARQLAERYGGPPLGFSLREPDSPPNG